MQLSFFICCTYTECSTYPRTLSLDSTLTTVSKNHTVYLVDNLATGHNETQGLPGYTGSDGSACGFKPVRRRIHGRRAVIHPVDCPDADGLKRIDIGLCPRNLDSDRFDHGFQLYGKVADDFFGSARECLVPRLVLCCRRVSCCL
ncbi:hypothetical protein SAMN05192544_1001315 [Paraburkholderia hospita]|uniref:Uncharacterized protein n=1 Tax=Paraburkholderia hospita TaxID=169430 RepID=A0AAN1J5F4_9BURK|nr:hypothetical protein C2L64_00875 [Paraburkholderia hospita]SEH41238.1 hypothetical protein SAMN05192544_1001315 [Paraburkholderia hospita]